MQHLDRMWFSYSDILKGTRIDKAVNIQRAYRRHRAFVKFVDLLLFMKRTASARVVQSYYALHKRRQYLKSRERIPSLSMDLWETIFSFMERRFSVPHRRLSREFGLRYPSRLLGPTCGICSKQAFIPVSLRLGWQGSSLQFEQPPPFVHESDKFTVNKICLGRSEFCGNANNMYCLRCARDFSIDAYTTTGKVICPHGCCEVLPHSLPYGFRPYMLYGDWPRTAVQPAHSNLYTEMDRHGVGLTKCPRCSVDCVTILNAVHHVRTVCRRNCEC